MKTEQKTSHRSLDYGVGSLIILVISVGVAAIIYSVNIIPLDLLNIPAWVLGPFGVYTIIYSFIAGKDSTYYLVWGTVTFAVAFTSALYNVINPFVVFGFLLIVLAIIGLAAYRRSKQ